MAKSYKSNYAIWLLLFVGVSGLLFASTTSSQFFAFEIEPLSFGGNVELPNILCNVKVTVQGFDKNGNEVIEKQSSYLQITAILILKWMRGSGLAYLQSFYTFVSTKNQKLKAS